MTVWIL